MRSICCIAVLLVVAATSAAAEPPEFGAQIAPIFKKYCAGCHNADDREGELVLQSYKSLLEGGEHGAVIVPGKADESRMILLLTGKAKPSMPPEDNEGPTAEEIANIAAWINAGAKGPEGAEPDPTVLVTPKVKPTATPVDSISAVAIASTGQLAVARYGAVELLAADRAPLRKLEGHRGRVNAVAFSADGHTLAAAAGEPGLFGEVRLWNVADGTLIRTLQGHQDSLYAVALSPIGNLLATGSYDQQVKLWDAASGQELKSFAGHNDCVYDLSFRAGGKVLASASGDRTVKLWDVANGERLETFGQPTKEIYTVAFSPDGSRVAGAGADNRIRVWQVSADAKENTNPLLYSRVAHEGAIVKLVYSPDGQTLVTAAEDRTIKIWSADSVTERAVLERQPDSTPALAISPDNKRLLVGRLDGTLAVYELATGQLVAPTANSAFILPSRVPFGRGRGRGGSVFGAAFLLPLVLDPPQVPAKPELTSISLRGIQRGAAARIKLVGKNLADVTEVRSNTEKLPVKLIAAKAEEVEFEASPAADLGRGRYEVWTVGPSGESGRMNLMVDDLPQPAEVEPNDRLDTATPLVLPTGAWGVLAAKGDTDSYAFDAKAGQSITFDITASQIGSKADIVLTLFDPAGRVIAAANDFEGQPDPLLTSVIPADGRYVLRVSDLALNGGGEHFYRVTAGALPYATTVYPLSVPANRETEVELAGFNLPPGLKIKIPAAGAGEVDVPLDANAIRTRRPLKVVVGNLPEVVEVEPNNTPAEATPIPAPATVGGRISAAAPGQQPDVDLFRFDARAGQTWVIETEAARRSSPLDTVIEVLHADGRPVERLLLQATRDTYVTFRGVDANSREYRLANWEEISLNEFLYANGEVNKLFRAPQGPDSGFLCYEGNGGNRRGEFDTSSTVHALDEACYIVTPHPPGTKIAATGLPIFTLYYANDDDAQRRLGSDSRLLFTAPADGAYLVRVRDARDEGGDRYVYRLTVREARPDFNVSLFGANPTVDAGSGKVFGASVEMIDGFDGEIRVDVGGVLPPGFSVSTPLVIEAGHREAKGVIFAAADAPQPIEQNWSHTLVTATAIMIGQSVTKDVNNLGRIALGAKPKLLVQLLPDNGMSEPGKPGEITIAPGTRVPARLRIERNGFDGILNLEVNNLPHGVIVDDIGLNNVQILEGQTERQIFLHCDPWVSDLSRPIEAVGKAEGDQTSLPAILHVRSRAK